MQWQGIIYFIIVILKKLRKNEPKNKVVAYNV